MFGHAEVVSIVLLEPPDPRQSTQGTTRLVPVQDTEVGHPDRELSVRAVARGKDQGVRRAVHRLERERLLLDIELEHVFGIVLPVTRSLPQSRVEHVGRDDLLVVALAVLGLSEDSQSESLALEISTNALTRMNSTSVL